MEGYAQCAPRRLVLVHRGCECLIFCKASKYSQHTGLFKVNKVVIFARNQHMFTHLEGHCGVG